ncbi:winged helix-turn-helix domain-containing protein [Actinomadura barringtoniae]|uniref:Winged helix-turn-helix domain-containing protein n=1 Tax=Actinomadura barringtoniae TaxID=1427535 RepID=A0A939T319_9ACTN|nr:BTAD domain-containing putative transcriptional regulator [Actinomadura barringtoniae]MBO2447443.1 winged helix-turn-helix domain-containing protein [Actinomadura barringtoniae]
MRFGVLGPLAVWTDDGTPVAVPGLKVRALLAALLANEGRPVPADRLIDDLWGESLPGNPGASLSVKASQLRKILDDAEPGGRGLIASRPAGYQLAAAVGAVDAERFGALTGEARQETDPAARSERLAEALALWRGSAYADFADEAFTQPVIVRLEEQRLVALEEHAEVRLALGEHGELAGDLVAPVADHPFRERLRAALMRALYRSGRQGDALAAYDDLRERLADELGLDPSAELVALHQAILTQDPALDADEPKTRRPRTNLPVPSTALIGRDDAVAGILARLETDRLVTLTGPGGVGKTRLAIEAGRRRADSRAGAVDDGVWMVELAGFEPSATGSLSDVVTAVLDIREAPGASGTELDRLASSLGPRRMLLVLDNCEHVIERAAELVDRLLRTAPGLRVLATSREPLGLQGETVWAVPPLEVPARGADLDPASLADSAAVRLFTARASAAARGFELNGGNAAGVAVLCRRLDGIPLALELAATRVRALGVAGLVARLDDRFRLLATGHRGAPPRQQTLMAMIDWSWELLSEEERAVLRRLAVHADGCSLEAAEAVCGGDALDTLDLLIRLVDRSLVVMTDAGLDGPRYRLLESVAAYCADRLDEAGEHEELKRRHYRYYTDLAERAEPRLRGGEQQTWLRTLDAESGNLRSALDCAVAEGDGAHAQRMASALCWYWFLRGRPTEAMRSLSTVLAMDEAPSPARARAAAWQTGFRLLQGDDTDWKVRREAALRGFEEVDDPAGRALAEWLMAYIGFEVEDQAIGEALVDRAVATFRERGDRWGEATVLVLRAKYGHHRGDVAAVDAAGSRAVALFEEVGDLWGQLQGADWLAAAAELAGDYDRADRLTRDGLRMAEELHLWPDVTSRLAWLGWTGYSRASYAEARAFCERALRLTAEQGNLPAAILAELALGFTARKQGHLDEAEEVLGRLVKDVPADEGPPPYLTTVLVGLGYVSERRGDVATALRRHQESLAIAMAFDGPRDTAFGLEGVAGALVLAGGHAEAARLLGTAGALRRSKGLTPGPAEEDDIGRAAGAARAVLGDDAYAAEFARGAVLTPKECLASAAHLLQNG